MKSKIFSIYDGKAKIFNTPFFMATLGMAVRAFQDIAQDQNTMICRHPEDFTLYEIGEYEDGTAKLTEKIPMQLIAVASEFKTAKIQTLTPPPLAADSVPDKSHLEKALENSRKKLEVK